jgi:hypothetical protein
MAVYDHKSTTKNNANRSSYCHTRLDENENGGTLPMAMDAENNIII